MKQSELPDQGHSNWRTAPCPRCGNAVSWTIVQSASTKIVCTAVMEGKRGKGNICGFTMKRPEWDYLFEKPHMAKSMVKQFAKERRESEKVIDDRNARIDRIFGKAGES